MRKTATLLAGILPPANTADTTELEKLVHALNLPEGAMVFADKGYASENNRNILAQKKLNDGIMDKAARNKAHTHPD
jgi:IS5 family transposase